MTIKKEGTEGEEKQTPLFAGAHFFLFPPLFSFFTHSAGWTFYSLATTPADPYIFAANLFGTLLGLWYTGERERRQRETREGKKGG